MITIGIVDNDRFALPMLDMPLTDIPGPEICRRVRAASADIVVLGITSYSLDHYRQLAIDAGAQGLIAKSVTPKKELAEAMRNVLVRPFPGFPTTEQAHGSIVSASARRSRTLSKREREVLGLYADNYSTAEIAERLGIADSTVSVVVRHAKVKLDVATRSKAVRVFRALY
ncbi:response regulator transcription factor [Bifidobacterium bifidum]|uniref:DNA-binding response regulator n=1 Tax=Bifidobacterium bifidum TaxID=1681 RepID=A0A415C7B8_BIFBI|nr:response regulator transcription factor [Bifidobacterium bifidum]MBX9162043.1 response regulator transcription factor [Bifidobacterium bifidum]RGJ40634.1 DNA-binding response regulator [Bifidobacterium bifidum]RGJ58924.1 DNA-binding response regulator [Bifidobacterium bifidum]RGK10796.1 DNA-binding response regulator [Bifidobacterium bifidum]RGK12544.1 DNA-binding response regulator [Bifidobacterium bifidum]